MDATLVNGAPGCHQSLCGYLSTEYSLTIFGWLGPSKDVDFDVFEVEQMVDEEGEGFGHALQARSSPTSARSVV